MFTFAIGNISTKHLINLNMKVIFLSFEVSVSTSSEPVIKVGKPDYVFSGQFDKDDNDSFKSMCNLEHKVRNLVRDFKDLGYKVVVLRKEVSHPKF